MRNMTTSLNLISKSIILRHIQYVGGIVDVCEVFILLRVEAALADLRLQSSLKLLGEAIRLEPVGQ